MATYDALDYFQSQKSQEKNALRQLEEARLDVDQSRQCLETTELQLVTKKKLARELKGKLANLLATKTLVEHVDLAANRIALVLDVETKTRERVDIVEAQMYEFEDQAKEPSREGDEFNTAMQIAQVGLERAEAIQRTHNQLISQLEAVKTKNDELEHECKVWDQTRTALTKQLEDTKNELIQIRQRCLNNTKEVETTKIETEKTFLAKINAACDQTELELFTLKEQAISNCTLYEAEHSKLVDELAVIVKRRADMEIEVSNLTLALTQVQTELENLQERANISNTSPENQALLQTKREEIRVLRDSIKPFDLLWDVRRKQEESCFMLACTNLIDPKREEVLSLKRQVREVEETNTKMRAELSVLFEAVRTG